MLTARFRLRHGRPPPPVCLSCIHSSSTVFSTQSANGPGSHATSPADRFEAIEAHSGVVALAIDRKRGIWSAMCSEEVFARGNDRIGASREATIVLAGTDRRHDTVRVQGCV